MDAIEALTSRISAGPMTEPAPDDNALNTMFEAAMRAPDHGRIRPWRFIVLRGDARLRFGDLMVAQLRKKKPDVDADSIEHERKKPLRAPVVVAVAAHYRDHPKVPNVEQMLAAGAAAQNLMLAAHALGFGAVWKTGEPAYDPDIKTALGLDVTDDIVGYIYLGTKAKEMPATPKLDLKDFVREWTGVA